MTVAAKTNNNYFKYQEIKTLIKNYGVKLEEQALITLSLEKEAECLFFRFFS